MNVTVSDFLNSLDNITSNSSGNGNSSSFLFSYAELRHVTLTKAVLIFFFASIALIGNGIVCVIMLPKLWHGNAIPLNVLVLSLAVSDVLKMGLEFVPQAIQYVEMQWTMGVAACKVSAVFRSVFSNVSIGTIALISFERYRSVDKPSGAAFTTRSLSIALSILWIWNTGAACPQALWFTTISGPGGTTCTIPFEASPFTAFYTLATRIVNFFIPLVTSWICYLGVINKLRLSRMRVSEANGNEQHRPLRDKVTRRVTVTCFLLMALFTVSLAPFQLALLVLQYGDAEQRLTAVKNLGFLWMLTLLKSTANPFLYGIMWESFRKSVQRLCRICCRPANKVTTNVTATTKVSARSSESRPTAFPVPSFNTSPAVSKTSAKRLDIFAVDKENSTEV